MRIIEGQEIIDEQVLPAGKHVAEESWAEYGIRVGDTIIPCKSKQNALSRIQEFEAVGTAAYRLVKSTVVRLAWETATD